MSSVVEKGVPKEWYMNLFSNVTCILKAYVKKMKFDIQNSI